MRHLEFKHSLADPDVWMRPGMKPGNVKYWGYVLCYVDDVLSINFDPMSTMKGIKAKFKLKGDKIEEPDTYLGANISKMDNENS